MDSLFGWVAYLWGFIVGWFPHLASVNANEGGVKFTRGKFVRELKPGLHWYVPHLTEEPTVISVCRDSDDYTSQKLTTNDGRRIAISMTLVFKIVDPKKAIVVGGENLEGIRNDTAGAALTNAVIKRSWDELQAAIIRDTDTEPSELENEVLGRVADELADYGVLAMGVRVKDLTETLVVSHIGDGTFMSG